MKKVILVNQVSGPMFIDIANRYVFLGYNVELLTGDIEKTGTELDPSVDVTYFTKYRRENIILRLITWLSFFVQAWHYLVNINKRAQVLLVSNPPFIPLLANVLYNKKELDLKILIYDIYPDVLEECGYISKNSRLSKLWRKYNYTAYSNAEKLFTISQSMRNNLLQYTPSSSQWEVIYPWVDIQFIKPIPKDKNWFVKKYNLEDKIIIQYSGNMGITHDLISIMKVAERMIHRPEFVFMFIGDGAQKKKLEDYACLKKLTNTLFLPFQNPDVLPYSISSADVGIVALSNNATALSIPSKTFYRMAAGNLILCISDPDSELASIILDNNCGVVFSPSSVNDIADFLLSLTIEEIQHYKINSRNASLKYSFENASRFVV